MQERLYIVELSQPELRVMAQGLHVLLENKPTNSGTKALERLAMQTEVLKDPHHYQVYESQFIAPKGAVPISSVCYVPFP